MELLFDIDLSLLHKRQKIAAQPRNLGEREPMLGDIDSLTRQVRGSGVSFGWRGVPVDVHEVLLKLDGAYSRVNL